MEKSEFKLHEDELAVEGFTYLCRMRGRCGEEPAKEECEQRKITLSDDDIKKLVLLNTTVFDLERTIRNDIFEINAELVSKLRSHSIFDFNLYTFVYFLLDPAHPDHDDDNEIVCSFSLLGDEGGWHATDKRPEICDCLASGENHNLYYGLKHPLSRIELTYTLASAVFHMPKDELSLLCNCDRVLYDIRPVIKHLGYSPLFKGPPIKSVRLEFLEQE